MSISRINKARPGKSWRTTPAQGSVQINSWIAKFVVSDEQRLSVFSQEIFAFP